MRNKLLHLKKLIGTYGKFIARLSVVSGLCPFSGIPEKFSTVQEESGKCSSYHGKRYLINCAALSLFC